MANVKGRNRSRRRLSLSVRLSLLVLFAALVPLIAVLGINDYFARNALVNQGHQALTTDAQAKVSLVDRYIYERLSDGVALATLPTAPAFLACAEATQLPAQEAAVINAQANCLDPQLGIDFYKGSNQRALCVGLERDPNYMQWSLYTARGNALLSYVLTNDPKNPCKAATKTSVVPTQDLALAQKGQPFTGAVHYDQSGNYAYMNLYTPIRSSASASTVLGFLQAQLRLDYIWGVVNGENGANGTGSYAFITDASGTRIASAKSSELFTKQSLPASYQYVREQVHIANPFKTIDPVAPAEIALPWTYYDLSPTSTIEAVANNQIRTSLISAAVVALLAVLIGLFIGRRLTVPVRSSVTDLQGAATSLKQLASRQQSSAGEQQWVVDACRTGLESVRYLSDAMNQAAQRVIEASNWFSDYWDRLTEEQARRTVQHLLDLAHYIDEAARRQQTSSERLGKAISVTMQVSDQLVAGASAATTSADQLEQVVGDLQRVVGGRVPRVVEPAADSDDIDSGVETRLPALAAPAYDNYAGAGRFGASQGAARQLMPPAGGDAWRGAQSPQPPSSIWGKMQRSGGSDGLYGGSSQASGDLYGRDARGGQDYNGVPANSGWPEWGGRQ